MTHKIYALTDPATGVVRYVGQTMAPLAVRLVDHMRSAKKGRPKGLKGDWLRGLAHRGIMPGMVLLETCDRDWRIAEREWMAKFPDLLNTKPGGGGGHRTRLKGLPEHVARRLGVIPDAILAEEIGVTRKAITYHRHMRGIPASFDRTRNKPPPLGRKFASMDVPAECMALLGSMSDERLAQRFGVSKRTINRRRRAAGIPSYAAVTGCDGKIKTGEPHRRWT